MLKFSNYKTSPNLLCNLQVKKLIWFSDLSRASVRFQFTDALDLKLDFNYLHYPWIARWIFWLMFTKSDFFGLGLHGYYSLEISKKQKLANWNLYLSKLNIKKDSWFFYGLVISRHINFLSSTITLRNVFYNEIMEKTFPIFSTWNTLVGHLQVGSFKHFLSNFLRNRKFKKKLRSIWNYPRATCRITLV